MLETEVKAMAEQWVRAYNNHDIDALMSLYDPAVNFMPHSSPRQDSILEIRDSFIEGFASKPAMTFDDEQVIATEQMGYVAGVFKITVVNPADGSVNTIAGRALVIFRKDDEGNWKLIFDMDNRPPDVQV